MTLKPSKTALLIAAMATAVTLTSFSTASAQQPQWVSADAETVDMLLVQTIWRLNALRADDLQQWTLLRRLTAAAAEASGETGANWPVRLARLDLATPDGEVEEAELRDRALDLGFDRVGRQ